MLAKKKSGFFLGAAALVGALAFAAQSVAQDVAPDKFQAYLSSKAYNDLVLEVMRGLPPDIFARCPGIQFPPGKTFITQPVTFDANGLPTGGMWTSNLPVTGCGKDTVINLMFGVSKTNGKIKTLVLAPGTTATSMDLQRDAFRYVADAFRSRAKACDSPMVINTRFESFGVKNPPTADPGPAAGQKRPWWETWTLKGCGRTMDVPVNFSPDATGTNIAVPLKDIKDR
jgi:hypothetical protein